MTDPIITTVPTSNQRRQQVYYSLVREANRAAWQAMLQLVALQREWEAQNYSETLAPGEADNSGLVASDLSAVIFDAANAVATVLATNGYSTAMTKLL
jgi:maltoporin